MRPDCMLDCRRVEQGLWLQPLEQMARLRSNTLNFSVFMFLIILNRCSDKWRFFRLFIALFYILIRYPKKMKGWSATSSTQLNTVIELWVSFSQLMSIVYLFSWKFNGSEAQPLKMRFDKVNLGHKKTPILLKLTISTHTHIRSWDNDNRTTDLLIVRCISFGDSLVNILNSMLSMWGWHR